MAGGGVDVLVMSTTQRWNQERKWNQKSIGDNAGGFRQNQPVCRSFCRAGGRCPWQSLSLTFVFFCREKLLAVSD